MNMTIDEIKLILSIANAIGTAGVGLYMWISKRNDHTDQAISSLETRVTKVEAHMQHMPTHQEIAELGKLMAVVQNENENQTRMLARVQNQMNLINEWMLENK